MRPKHDVAETDVIVEIDAMESSMEPVIERAPAIIPGGMISRVAIVGADVQVALHPDESALVSDLPEPGRPSFIAGRRALRSALEAAVPALAHAPLLRMPRGGPRLPEGAMGSISHKRTHAIALAAPAASADALETAKHGVIRRHVGIDLEQRPSPDGAHIDRSQALARRILTARELEALRALTGVAHLDATLLRFALKEAVYKAIDPHVQRYVRFTEVELDVEAASESHATWGIARVALLLPERPPLTVHAAWQLDDGWIVAAAMSEEHVER